MNNGNGSEELTFGCKQPSATQRVSGRRRNPVGHPDRRRPASCSVERPRSPLRGQRRARMNLRWNDRSIRELLLLAALAAFACGLALSRGSFLFVALFAAVWAAIIIAIRLYS